MLKDNAHDLEGESSDADLGDAWGAEIARRVDELLEGRVDLVPARKVMDDLRAELRAMRK
jgi:hypothetical protein